MKRILHKYFAPISTVLFVLLVLFDQWTKQLAETFLKGQDEYVIWEGVFELSYLENRGAAWGMLQNKQGFFYILTVIFIAAALLEIRHLKSYDRFLPLRYILVITLSGACGNFIDRWFRKYVIDFFYIKLIDFPIFNVADCYITFSVAILIALIFFYYSEEEFERMLPARKKKVD